MITSRIAHRYLFTTKGRLFARALTFVAIGSVMLGVYAMLVVLGVMLGFRDHLETKLLGFLPHVTVRVVDAQSESVALEKRLHQVMEQFPGRLVPIVEGEVVAQPGTAQGFADLGVRVRGLHARDLEVLRGATFYFASDLAGEVTTPAGDRAFLHDPATGQSGIVVGNEVLYALGVYPDTNRDVVLTAPLGMIDPVGNLQPVRRTYAVRGYFRSGLYQQDSKLVFMDYDEAHTLLGTQGNPQWFVYLEEPRTAEQLAQQLKRTLGATLEVHTWMEQNQKLLAALRLERIVMSILLAVTVGIACLSIMGVVFMQVVSRRRDLAVLVALGASPRHIRTIVITMGGWVGLLGSALGLLAAALTTWWCAHHPIQLPATFYLDYLPLELRPLGTVIIVLFGIGLAVFAAWYPARIAAGFAPAEGLRSE